MERADKDLAFLLQYENVAWFEDGKVRILDRRIYPIETKFVECTHHTEVAQAIADMVTQSGGPYTAAAMGMVLAFYEAKNKPEAEMLEYMEKAAYTLSHARPTTKERMKVIVSASLEVLKNGVKEGKAVDAIQDDLFNYAFNYINNNYTQFIDVASHLVKHFPEKGTVMTQCFAETIVGMMARECRIQGKDIAFICPETRPYFQGARLTASVLSDMDFDVHVVTDNMPGYIINNKKVDVFTSAADVISMDGHVVNKVGTFQIAMAAHYWGIPYFVTGTPNKAHPHIDSVIIEERDSSQVMEFMGIRTTKPNVKAYYPAFDITPPQFVSGVVTKKGMYSPYDLHKFYEADNE